MPYREKKIFSGPWFEVELFPITMQEQRQSRAIKNQMTRPKQKNLNDKNAKKHLIRLLNRNFTDDDLAVHLTYDPKHLPSTADQARRDMANFIRRVKSARKKRGLTDLRYIAVIECKEPETGREGIRIHHHVVMSGDMSRDDIEDLWGKGRCNADRLQADESGYEGLARYISKDPHGSKRWCQSKNLKQPEVSVNDHRYSKRKVEQLATCQGDREFIEALYPGYTLTEIKPEINPVTGAIHVYIKMRIKPAPKRKEQSKPSRRANDD